MTKTLLDVAHVSRRGASLRITLPKKVAEKLETKPGDIVIFSLLNDKIVVEKMKL